MRLAVWNNPVTTPVFVGLKDAFGETVSSASAARAVSDLKSGLVDVALIPSDVALSSPEDFDILPAVAISSWCNPFAVLKVGTELGSKSMGIIHTKEGKLFALLSAIVLKEHYGTVVVFNERDNMPDGIADRALISIPLDEARGEEVGEAISLDLGQEWYEMVNYPFVWAVFAMRKGEANDATIVQLRDAIILIDDKRADFSLQWNLNDDVESFFLNELRLRLDDMAVASLTELSDHLYYYGTTEEILPVVFASLSEDADDEELD